MKRNFDGQIHLINGTPVVDSDWRDSDGQPQPLLLKHCIVNALVMNRESEALSGDEKLKRYDLATRVQKGGDIELTVDEIARIKTAVERNATTLIYGQVVHALNTDLKPEKEDKDE